MKLYKILLLAGLSACLASSPLFAQPKSAAKTPVKAETPKDETKKEESELRSIDEIVRKCKRYAGLLPMYQDTTNGKVYLQINKQQLDKDFIHFSQIIDGPPDIGTFRGGYTWGKIFRFNRYFDKIQVTLENTAFYFDPANPLSRAADANINKPVVFIDKIAGANKAGTEFLIDADKLFLAESFEQYKPSPHPKDQPGQFKIGSLSKEKSKIIGLKNYPENTDLQVELVYEEPYPMNYGTPDVTDARYVSVRVHNSIIAVPKNDYEPRYDDPRVGFFAEQVTDMTSTNAAPYRDLIDRWHLKKKDPGAALSEPVEPIVWWIENTTPKELRAHVRDGVLQWNRAFEKAGFRNAMVVKEQPDNADWDAGDIRYNVLRWTSSPRPIFGGYGPSFVNPRTGQILGADIMLEYVFITNRLREQQLFETSALNYLDYDQNHNARHCNFASHLQRSVMLGRQVIAATDRGAIEENKLLEQSLYMLTLHEVGHTLGLNHNMKASNLHDPVKIHDEKLGREVGLTGSVMDYSNVNIALDPAKQGLYYDVTPGPYDLWAIEFGYKPCSDCDGQSKALMNRSAEHALMFGNDADDMRSPGHGIDPRVMIDDMSSDPVAYSIERIQLVQQTLPKIKQRFAKPEQSYQALRNAYFVLTSELGISLRVISRQIGGVYVDRSFVGQPGASAPLRPVPYQKQKDAMGYLTQYAFSPTAFNIPADLYSLLLPQRRGYNHFWYNEDPKVYDRILYIHRDILEQLMHRNTLQRIVDSELYGNSYKLTEYMTDLTDGIFREDLAQSVNTMRQNLQVEYVKRLASMTEDNAAYGHTVKSMAFAEMNRIKKMFGKSAADPSTKAHREYLAFLINKTMYNGKGTGEKGSMITLTR